jgi:RND superfamily putative drug exporter
MFAGETPLSAETVDAIIGDLRRIAVAVLVLTFVVLALYLRALVAPLLLLIASTLAFAGAYGLTALLLPHVIGGDDFVYYVPLVGAVLLVALGSDYNVFIAGRIREEAQKRRLREAIAVAAPSASRAITVAGITLASTFALLALIDLVPFQQLALLMAVGVLVDALLVRPLLIPALLSVAGPRAWWPGQPARPPKTEAFLLSVALQTEQPLSDARRMTEATLGTLAERLSAPQARELAPHLPPSLMRAFERAPERAETFGFDEFVERVARRTGTSRDGARNDVAAVFATLRETLPATELEYVHAALSRDYEVVFDGHAGHAARGEPAVPR